MPINAIENNFLINTYKKFGLILKSGKKCYFSDIDGKEYLDFASGVFKNINNTEKMLDKNFLLEIQGKSLYLKMFIERMKGVIAVIGEELMFEIETKYNSQILVKECIKKGLLVLSSNNKLLVFPPLNISKTEIEEGLQILNIVFNKAK